MHSQRLVEALSVSIFYAPANEPSPRIRSVYAVLVCSLSTMSANNNSVKIAQVVKRLALVLYRSVLGQQAFSHYSSEVFVHFNVTL